jgi:hypothetical protein
MGSDRLKVTPLAGFNGLEGGRPFMLLPWFTAGLTVRS